MNTKIGIFDSGIGGITVLKECLKLNPNFEYIYYSDSINNPYGDKEPKEVEAITSQISEFLINKGCSIIVIACNTASTISANYLREKYPNIKFLAIEPAIKLASENSNECLIMATKGTLDSEKFKQLYEKYHHENYYLLPCIGLANLIENNNQEQIDIYLKEHLSKYQNKVSSVVLGCTHFPLAKEAISKVLGPVTFVHGGPGIANRVKYLLLKNNICNDEIININDNVKFVPEIFKTIEIEEKIATFIRKINN